jgi:hypothetical protein
VTHHTSESPARGKRGFLMGMSVWGDYSSISRGNA